VVKGGSIETDKDYLVGFVSRQIPPSEGVGTSPTEGSFPSPHCQYQ
jgi:hypothetical protein